MRHFLFKGWTRREKKIGTNWAQLSMNRVLIIPCLNDTSVHRLLHSKFLNSLAPLYGLIPFAVLHMGSSLWGATMVECEGRTIDLGTPMRIS